MSSEAKKNSPAAEKQQENQQNLPLFFKSPAPLDANRHKKAGLVPIDNFSFAAHTNSIPLDAIEFAEAAKSYPIVFTQSASPMPVAVVGLEQDNYFVGADGKWKAGTYMPAYVRKYPFVFMDLPEREQFLLCVDEAAPQFKTKGGDNTLPFYNGEEASDLTKNALEFCAAFHNHYQFSQRLCQALLAANLFEPTQSDAKLYSGREIHLSGFQVVDEKRFNELPEAKFLEFRKEGWLPFIYFALMSGSNWQRLVDLAAERERKKAN